MKDYKIEKILVIQTAFIGDAVLTLPMIQILKKTYAGSEIHVVCIPSTEEIFSASPYVKKVIVLDKRGEHSSVFSVVKFAENLKKENYSRIYSPHRSLRTALLVMFTGIRETFGFTSSSLSHVYKNLIEYKTSRHEVQRNLDLVGYRYSEEGWKILPEVLIPDNEKNKVDEYINYIGINNGYICIAPGSVWNTKIYPSEYIEEIIKYIIKNSLYSVLLIGGEKDKSLCSGIAEKFSGSVYSAAGKFSITGSIEILKRAILLITNDSAPTHLAMCADIPAITIYCSTVADFGFYPYNGGSSFLSYDDLFCKPCGIHGYVKCPIDTFDCGYNLRPDVVIGKIEDIINGRNKDSKVY